MTQAERDRLVVLKKAQKKLITQAQAAQELGISMRQVRRSLRALKAKGDRSVIHALRGRPSQRKISGGKREQIVKILSQDVYRGFGPTLASEYLRDKHQVKIGREALRQIMMGPDCGGRGGTRWKRCTSGGRGGVAAGRWYSGTPASTIGWRAAGRSCT